MIRKAIVLAAGRGTRMGELTEETPKPMLRVGDAPMLEHIVRRLQSVGIEEILLVVGYRRDLLQAHFRNFPGISFVAQEVVDGTASAVKLGRTFIGDEPFLLTFGDIITPAENYAGIGTELENSGAATVLGVKWAADPWRGAAVYASPDGRVTRIIEKPPPGTSTTNWNSAGLYSMRPRIFREIETIPRSSRGEYEITAAIEQLIAKRQLVRMFEMQGAWLDVGRPEDLAAAPDDLLASE